MLGYFFRGHKTVLKKANSFQGTLKKKKIQMDAVVVMFLQMFSATRQPRSFEN